MAKANIGDRNYRLTVIEEAPAYVDSKGRRRMWKCRCDCGNLITVREDSLGSHTKSCGCLQKERAAQSAREHHTVKHGDSRERIHNIWYLMKYRCTNPKSPAYAKYGGKGIRLCDEWADDINGYFAFKNWAIRNGYSEELTIDRIDNDGNYCPENCRWVNAAVQNNNKRANRKLTYNGETHNVAQWSEILGVDRRLLYNRVYLGWDVDRIFTQPYRKSSTRVSNITDRKE